MEVSQEEVLIFFSSFRFGNGDSYRFIAGRFGVGEDMAFFRDVLVLLRRYFFILNVFACGLLELSSSELVLVRKSFGAKHFAR